MSGGSQHNPNGRQSQLGPGWSPLQLQMASYLARAPQAHMAERGVSWHTPTPPPHLYHMPTSSSPDPLQAMKAAASGGNSVFRHTATPPDLFRHTPTPPDKHLLSRHTPSPGDPKAGVSITPAELFPLLGPARDKLVRPEDLYGYGRAGVDLSVSRSSGANGAPMSLSVRDAPTINSLIARAAPRRVDSLLERLAAAPSVIVHPRPPASSPSPPSPSPSSADDEETHHAPKRKRKPDKTLRLTIPNGKQDHKPDSHRRKTTSESSETIDEIAAMIAADDAHVDKEKMDAEIPTAQEAPVTVDKLKSVLSSPHPDISSDVPPKETESSDLTSKNDDVHEKLMDVNKNPAESPERADIAHKPESSPQNPDNISVVTATETSKPPTPQHAEEIAPEKPVKAEKKKSPKKIEETPDPVETASAPKRRRSARLSDSTNVPIESPSEGKPAETPDKAPPQTTSFVEVETELAKMFAGIEEQPNETPAKPVTSNIESTKAARKRRKSVATKGERKARRPSRSMTEESVKKKPGRKKQVLVKQQKKERVVKDVGDSGSNASSSRSRGPYIQIRGPRESPVSVHVKNASTADEENENKRGGEFRNGHRVRGLHSSTLGLRYDAASRDLTWLCVFCGRQPHAERLGDLFGPYALDEAEVWMHEECAVWAPGLLGAGARLWGLDEAVSMSRGTLCGTCGTPGAGLACAARGCMRRSHVPCARNSSWTLDSAQFKAHCPLHRPQ